MTTRYFITRRIHFTAARSQRGAALFMALMFLIIITMLSLSAMRSSVMELRMAGNAESKAAAMQRAQSVIDATVADSANMPVVGDVLETTCLPGSGCTRNNIALQDVEMFQGEIDAGLIGVTVTRLAPLSKPAPRTRGDSLREFSVATFEVNGRYDGASEGLGRAEIVEGLLVRIPGSL